MLYRASAIAFDWAEIVDQRGEYGDAERAPMLRARARMEDATPISDAGTADAMVLVRGPMPKPMKRAISASGHQISKAVERGSMNDRK